MGIHYITVEYGHHTGDMLALMVDGILLLYYVLLFCWDIIRMADSESGLN